MKNPQSISGVVIFDASTIISLAMNGLLDELEALKKTFDGKFLITQEVKYEVVDRPMNVKRFELEALIVDKMLREGTFELPSSLGIGDREITHKTTELLNVANDMFESGGNRVNVIHEGEASCLALSRLLLDKKIPHVIAIDERTTRMLSEKPENLKELLERKMKSRIKLKKSNFKYFRGFRFIRSAELLYVAWKKGVVRLKDGKKVLDALLYAVKFKGCSITDDEIREIKSLK